MTRNLPDWLEYYMKYTQNSEPPTQYHLWSGIAAISSCLQRKCWSHWGMSGGDIYPNFYIALVGPPGGRKGTAMKFAKEFILDLDLPTASDSLGSVQALYLELMEAKGNYKDTTGSILDYLSLSVWAEEFAVFLAHQDSVFVKSVTDLFDCPDRWKYRSLKQGIKPIHKCYLTIIGAITPSLLQESLTSTSVGGGLFSRIIFVTGYGKIKKVALGFLSKEERLIKTQLLEDLEVIKNMAGQFKMDDSFMKVYVPWYNGSDATDGVDSDKFVGYNERRAMHLKKLCMVLSAAESNDMILTKDHYAKALNILRYTESEMTGAFYGLGRGYHANIVTDLMRFLEEKGTTDWKEVLTKFQLDMVPQDLNIHLQSLSDMGKIEIEVSTTGNSRYIWRGKAVERKGIDFLNTTIFRLMDDNL